MKVMSSSLFLLLPFLITTLSTVKVSILRGHSASESLLLCAAP